MIGDGETNFWAAPILNGTVVAHVVPFIHISNFELKIKDLLNNGSWDIRSLYTPIPVDVKKELESQRGMLIHRDAKDGWRWGSGLTGSYSAKDGYKWFSGLDLGTSHKWAWI